MDSLLIAVSSHTTGIIITLISILFLLFCVVFFLFFRYRQLSKTLAYILRGKTAVSLEDTIIGHSSDIDTVQQDISALHTEVAHLHKTVRASIHKKAIIRYNPFKDLGGDQSFALAFLDGKHDGVIISSLHTKDGTRVYAKPITNGVSHKYHLSEEEERAIRLATNTKSE